MTADQWDEITVVMLAYWPNKEIPSESFDVWFNDLSAFEGEQVAAAVIALGRDGREWMPNGGQIRSKIIDLRSETLDWAAAFELCVRGAGEGGGYQFGGLAWIQERSPLAAKAVEQYGWYDFCRGTTDLGTVRAQFRDLFNMVADKANRDERYLGISAEGLKGLPSAPKKLGFVSLLTEGDQ